MIKCITWSSWKYELCLHISSYYGDTSICYKTCKSIYAKKIEVVWLDHWGDSPMRQLSTRVQIMMDEREGKQSPH